MSSLWYVKNIKYYYMMYNNTYGGINQWNEHWQKCAIEQKKVGKKCPVTLALSTYTRKPTYAELLLNTNDSNLKKLEKKYAILRRKYQKTQDHYFNTVETGKRLLQERDDTINILEDRFNDASIQYDNLLEDNSILQSNLDICDSDFEYINNELIRVKDEYNELAAKHLKQSDEYISLIDSFDELEQRYNELLEINVNNEDLIHMKTMAIKHLEKEVEFGNNRLLEISRDRDLIIEKYENKENEINNLLSNETIPLEQLNLIKEENEKIEDELIESLNNLDKQEKIIISKNEDVLNDIEKILVDMPLPKVMPSLKELETRDIDLSSEFEKKLFEKAPKGSKTKKVKTIQKGRKNSDLELNKLYKSKKQLTKQTSQKLSKNDLGYLHNKCLGLSRASWAGKSKDDLVKQYNKCIKELK